MQNLLSSIRRLYAQAPQAALVREVQEGYLSRNFILDNRGEKFFLKQYRFDSVEKIREIHRAKFFFAKGGIPVVLPIKNAQGEFFFEEVGKFYALFPFIEGRILERVNLPRHAFESAARMLAKIHLLSKSGCPNIVADHAKGWDVKKFFEGYTAIREKIECIKNKSDFDQRALCGLELKKSIIEANALTYKELGLKNDHLIHGDYHGNNIFYDENDDVKYVFDLEKTRRAPRVFELVRGIDFMCFSSHFEEKNFADAHTFLQMYSEMYPIAKEELVRGLRVYFLKKAHSVWIEREHYLNNSNRVDCFLAQEPVLLTEYSEHFDYLASRLTEVLYSESKNPQS